MTADALPVTVPRRFRGAPERNARIARPLALLGRVREVDEDLVDEIGRRMLLRDEVGADLAAAMRPGASARTTMAALDRALADGTTDADPPALRRFVAELEREPVWLDRDLLERGRRSTGAWGPRATTCCSPSRSSAATATRGRPTCSSARAV